MAYSVRIVLRKYKPNSIGYHILQLCVTKNSCRKRISLKLYVDPAYWDNSAERLTIERNLKGEKQREANKKRIQDNAFLDKVKAHAREIIEKFEIDGIDWTLNQFEDAFLNPSKQGKFCAYLESHIQTLRDTGHTGNAKCYFETLRLLKYYDSKLNQRLFSDIDLRYVRNFDTFLQKRGCKGNTRKYYFKALRAILNQAKREGVGSEAAYPFVKGGFEIAKLEEATEKRYLPPQDLQKLKDTPAQNPHGFALILRHYVQSSPHLFDRSSMAKQNLSHRANVICDGSPSRIRRVRRISFGMTIRPRSSMRLTMPVAFIYCSSTLCVRNHIAIVCKQWGIMRIEGNKADGSLQIAHCDPHMRITGCIYEVSRLHRLTTSTFTDTIILSNCKRDYRK